MRILSIETATAVCAAALIEDKNVIAERFSEEPRAHSENIVKFVEYVFQLSGSRLRDVDVIAVSAGPGSFTGLRIGVSVAKGLAFAAGKPLTAVPTLEALARNSRAGRGELVVAMIDARRDEVFAAAYRNEGERWKAVVSPGAFRLQELHDLLDEEQKITLVGDGTEKFQRYCMEIGDLKGHSIPSHSNCICSAVTVGLMGAEQFSRGELADLASLEPFYGKEFFTTMKPLSAERP